MGLIAYADDGGTDFLQLEQVLSLELPTPGFDLLPCLMCSPPSLQEPQGHLPQQEGRHWQHVVEGVKFHADSSARRGVRPESSGTDGTNVPRTVLIPSRG